MRKKDLKASLAWHGSSARTTARPCGLSICSATLAFAMNNRIAVAVRQSASAFAVALLAAGCASLPTTDPQADYPKERAQIERSLQGVFAAAEDKNFNRLDDYHYYGPKFTKFTGSSSERQDATVGRKAEHDGLASIKGLKMRADSLKID